MNERFRRRSTSDPEADAARWLLRLEKDRLSVAQQRAFERWVEAGPAHRAALERAATALEITSRHAAAPGVMKMREVALRARGRRQPASWALAASVAAIGVMLGLFWATGRYVAPTPRAVVAAAPVLEQPRPTHYATEVGERATISLPDGSAATLDTGSALDVLYTASERGIRLLRGQALFEVAKHQSRPFQVYAGDRRITALGTTFNVRLDGRRLRVALIEGRIRVTAHSPGERSRIPIEQMTLNPGEVLDTAQSASMIAKVADVVGTISWREGVAAFVDARLADVVVEMNRYVPMPITIDDPSTGELRVSGVFKTGDPERFAKSVASVFPIEVVHDADGGVVLRAMPAPN